MGRAVCLAVGLLAFHPSAYSASEEIAIRLYQKLAGVPPIGGDLDAVKSFARNDELDKVADLAMTKNSFLVTTVKNFASPMSNVAGESAIDLNDFSATVLGMARDELPMDELLYGDYVYVGKVGQAGPGDGATDNIRDLQGLSNFTAHSWTNNRHFRELELQGIDLTKPNFFHKIPQNLYYENGLRTEDTMGVMTTRAAGEAFMQAGTNRRMIRFMLVNFLCVDMEQMHDTTLSDYRVRQDVPRNAGGDSRTYINNCAGCHAGMDPLAGAFAYFDWKQIPFGNQDQTAFRVFRDGSDVVQEKMIRLSQNFPQGYRTTDDSWVNLWTVGQNAFVGFRPPRMNTGMSLKEGRGPKSLGMVFSATEQFSRCMAQRAYATVCNRHAPYTDSESALFAKLGVQFEQDQLAAKPLFKNAAIACVNNEAGE